MQFKRQGTKVFIKLELRKIHIFILQYLFIQLLLIYQNTIHMYSSTDRPSMSRDTFLMKIFTKI